MSVLYVIACGAPPARQVGVLVDLAYERGWTEVCVLTTPKGREFVAVTELETRTGYPVRSHYKHPDEADVLPPPDAVIVAPATVSTLNKWAGGICDTLPLGILVEGIGKRLPIVALPFTNRAQAKHPALADNIARLRSWGPIVLYGDDIYPLHEPGTGSQHLDQYPWHLTLYALENPDEAKVWHWTSP